jgi:hypothetical protein
MSRDASIRIFLGDGEKTFRLGLGELERLDEATQAGPAFLLGQFQSGRWRIRELRETIRFGLIGGGATAAEADRLLRAFVDPPNPLADSILIATSILAAALVGGGEDDMPGKPEAASQMGSPTPEAG